jgi:pimeloyl-ACP methyl ester carboxylesterase
VLLFHGVPSCRLEATVHLPSLRKRSDIRVLAVDRPGFGQSDPAADICFEAWPTDVAALADALGVKQFSLIASSGGAPYALAVARAFPDRVPAVALGCPMAPIEAADTTGCSGAWGAVFAQQHPVLARAALNRFIHGLRRHPQRIPFVRMMGSAERAHLADQETHAMYVQISIESFRQSPAEVCRGAAVLAQPWAGWLKEVKPKVTIFQGCIDEIVSPAMARYLATTLPKAELRLFEGEGHMSCVWKHSAAMLAAALTGK